MLSFTELTHFYDQFSRMHSAGVPIERILIQAPRWVKSRHQDRVKLVANLVQKGQTLSQAFDRSGLFSYFDTSIINAGEVSGKIAQVCKYLSNRYQQKTLLRKKIVNSLVYPATLITLALLLFPLIDLFAERISMFQYILQSFGVIAILIALIWWGAKTLTQLSRDPRYEDKLLHLQRSIPLIGNTLKRLAQEEYFVSLALLIEAGIPILEATQISAKVSNNFALKNVATNIHLKLSEGMNLTQAFATEAYFDSRVVDFITTGEESGTLDEMLTKIASELREDVESHFNTLAAVLPKIIYLVVALYVGYKIIKTYSNIYSGLNGL